MHKYAKVIHECINCGLEFDDNKGTYECYKCGSNNLKQQYL